MLNTTLSRLQCPALKKNKQSCDGELQLFVKESLAGPSKAIFEVRSGHLLCVKCKKTFPILAGVAVLVSDVRSYLLHHVKGISQVVADADIPREFLHDYREAKAEIQVEHIEDDLEAERVTALYLMNHYLRADQPGTPAWWSPLYGEGSPLVDQLIREHWDHGPFEQIQKWISKLSGSKKNLVELGCGVGGLYRTLKPHLRSYLGVDSSFASIALARHFALGVPYRGSVRIPEDLLFGQVSREIKIPVASSYDGTVDFVMGDLENLPLKKAEWDISVALNTIDMLERPALLPELQQKLVDRGGVVIQSCPYIWHEGVARKLRKGLKRSNSDSARLVESLYEQVGLKIENRVEHCPWLFFKHLRQLEIYSVHLFFSRK